MHTQNKPIYASVIKFLSKEYKLGRITYTQLNEGLAQVFNKMTFEEMMVFTMEWN